MASETGTRIVVAAVGIPIAVALVYLGGWALAALLAAAAVLAALELYRMAGRKNARPLRALGAVVAAGFVLLAALAPGAGPEGAGFGHLVVLATLAVPAVAIWARGVEGEPLLSAATTLLGAVYTGAMLAFGLFLRHLPGVTGPWHGTAIVFLPVLLTWASDTFAYFVGRAWGTRKLIPRVSPGKTVQGALGALAGTMLVALGYSLVLARFPAYEGRMLGEVGLGNRKDVRNAVEAAHAAAGWARATGHSRAQVLYYVAENLAARAAEFAGRLLALTGDEARAGREVELSIERLYTYAAWADKWEGRVHHTPYRNVTIAMPEPIGVLGVVCPAEAPLLGFVSTVMPAIAVGNAVVAVPSEPAPLAATDFYQVLDTSDVPGGVVNIVTGHRDELAEVLAGHFDVDGVWYFGTAEGSAMVERLSAGNMKRTWVGYGRERDWFSREQGEGEEFLRHATQVKNIWIPYGE